MLYCQIVRGGIQARTTALVRKPGVVIIDGGRGSEGA